MMTEGLEKKLRQIDNEYQARKDEIAKQEAGWKRDNAKAGQSGSLSEDQQSEIDKARELNESGRQKKIAEAYREEFGVMPGIFAGLRHLPAAETRHRDRICGKDTKDDIRQREALSRC